MPTNDHSFKIGDRVRRSPEGRAVPGCYAPSAVGVVTNVGKDWISINNGGISSHNYWELDSSTIDEAKALLEKEGYTVTPPKPKQTGKVYIIQFPGCFPLPTSNPSGYDASAYKLLAIVNWTEGEGLENGER